MLLGVTTDRANRNSLVSMGYLYFDDSKHPRAGFNLGAFVYCEENPENKVSEALKKHGLVPGVDEFKSSAHMGRHPEQAAIRELLLEMLHFCRLGVVVTPYGSNATLGKDALILLIKMLKHRHLSSKNHEVYFDQAIFKSVHQAVKLAGSFVELSNCKFHFEQDSRCVPGIQLADLAAHTCAIMLLETLGIVNKTVKAGKRLGYEPDLDIEIGFELWANVRYTFLSEPTPVPKNDWEPFNPVANVLPYGLHVSDEVNETLREAAESRFGSMYLGCTH